MSGHDQSLQDLIEGIRFAMFTTRSHDGALHSRPMTTQDVDADASDAGERLWFFMSRSSEPVSELNTDPKVNVSYADLGKDAYVSVSGIARLVEDAAIKQRLWSKMNEIWFPKGVEDPDLALVCVEVDEAEYWNVKESKLVQMAKMAKAAITGKRPTDIGEHVRVRGD
ncbi:MAG TPA: pyridoxamine 5'-phosphate oxidase family protein [Nitrosospira sp.]|nr:pyridoxamine 5'-phosphate oxidase family protein [Nitrosospira sp.]